MADRATESIPRILVVDDDWMNREVMEAHLLDAGYEVVVAHSGEQALALTVAQPPDLILMDVRMQGMSGYEACARLKLHDATCLVPVVMVTALDSDEEKLKAIEAGADDFLVKPFTSLTMLTRVKSLVRISQLHRELATFNDLLQRVSSYHINTDLTSGVKGNLARRQTSLDGETRHVTLFFCGLKNFMVDQRPAPEALALLNHFLEEMTDVIFRHQGTFDKYVGETIMAFFGAPGSMGDAALNAVQAAAEMQQVFAAAQAALPASDVENLGLGVGLHSGRVSVGFVGSDDRRTYTAIGDSVNIALRLQAVAQDGEILVSEATFAEIADFVEARQLPPMMIEYNREPMTIYQVLALKQTHV